MPRGREIDVWDDATQEVINALWPDCDPATLESIAATQRMRATYARIVENR